MLSSAQSVTPKPAAMPPAVQAPQTALPGSGSAGGPSFAQFLNDLPLQPPAHPDPVPSEPDTAAQAKAAPAPAPNTASTRRKDGNATSAKPAAPAPDAKDAGKAPAKDAKATEASQDSTEADDAKAAGDTDAETSGLNEFTQLIGMAVPPQTTTPQPVTPGLPGAADAANESGVKGARAARAGRVAADEATTDTRPRGDAGDTGAAVTSEQQRPADTHARATDAPRAKGIELAADKATAAQGAASEALKTATAAPGEAAPRMAGSVDAAAPNFSALLAQAMPAAAAATDTSSVTATGQVHAAVQSNAFASELGARVSLLAVDGVQQAELQLNPADMGPVAVQIVVDGSQAQVSFHAAQAETRQALEQSLPDLAAALQSQGLTLSGGGVFQQAQQDSKGGETEAGSGSDGRGSRTNTGDGRVAASAAAAPIRRSVGLLDTFA